MLSFFFDIVSCLNSRWDKPAQPKQSVDVKQKASSENASRPISLPGVIGSAGPNSTVSEPPEAGGKPAPQGGVEMAAAMAAKINAMLMAKGKLLTPPPLLAKVHILKKIITVYLFEQLLEDLCFSMSMLQTPPSVPAPATIEEMVVTEVDINDVPLNCRDLLTKGKTQEEVSGKKPWQFSITHTLLFKRGKIEIKLGALKSFTGFECIL